MWCGLVKLIADGHHEYHKEYYWPKNFSFANKGLLSLNLQHSLFWVYVCLGTLPLQMIHTLPDSKVSCFLFLEMILLWMYNAQLTCCLINIWSSRYWNTHHPKLICEASQYIYALLHGNKLSTKNWCLFCRLFLWEPLHRCDVHISGSHFLICEKHCLLYDCYPQTHKCLPPYLDVQSTHRYSLLCIPVELWPITFLKNIVIYFWVQRIIHQSGIVPLINMGHDICF